MNVCVCVCVWAQPKLRNDIYLKNRTVECRENIFFLCICSDSTTQTTAKSAEALDPYKNTTRSHLPAGAMLHSSPPCLSSWCPFLALSAVALIAHKWRRYFRHPSPNKAWQQLLVTNPFPRFVFQGQLCCSVRNQFAPQCLTVNIWVWCTCLYLSI